MPMNMRLDKRSDRKTKRPIMPTVLIRPPRPSHFKARLKPRMVQTGKKKNITTSFVFRKPPNLSSSPKMWAKTKNSKKANISVPQIRAIQSIILAVIFVLVSIANEI